MNSPPPPPPPAWTRPLAAIGAQLGLVALLALPFAPWFTLDSSVERYLYLTALALTALALAALAIALLLTPLARTLRSSPKISSARQTHTSYRPAAAGGTILRLSLLITLTLYTNEVLNPTWAVLLAGAVIVASCRWPALRRG